ncbi:MULTISPECIES: DUF2934 domain-containing protein [unclassified Rhizobium]|uniref:DUF2934 domain-containing protein n=1 Tax=unclassified Rhizobium TaxID=2613769 RepID=UPI0017D731D6|nr:MULTISPECIES: DUF2934 domain-containing protein [unclassified Rhizobium]MBB3446965.1 hypothetical protein [Rhizobium sp. BK379]MBB3565505.1 hypothetical protein [Rhizobium sp. BK512]
MPVEIAPRISAIYPAGVGALQQIPMLLRRSEAFSSSAIFPQSFVYAFDPAIFDVPEFDREAATFSLELAHLKDDREQAQRERAYKIWRTEGRQGGRHLDHWVRADEDGEAVETEAAELTDANQAADREFNVKGDEAPSPMNNKPPSVASAD